MLRLMKGTGAVALREPSKLRDELASITMAALLIMLPAIVAPVLLHMRVANLSGYPAQVGTTDPGWLESRAGHGRPENGSNFGTSEKWHRFVLGLRVGK